MVWLLFSQGKTPGTHSTGSWMDPRRILNTMEKREISVYYQEKKVHKWNLTTIVKNKI
jgi:hypothetical protein